jgi:DNA-binding transcriptional LysR family regulator
MDLKHARTFVTVAELGTVSKAAQQLHIAQPALSRQIRDLEQELGLALFERIGRRLLLSGEGEQLLGDCRALLAAADAVRERALELQRGDAGVLRVASSPQSIEGAIADFLPRFAERHPRVQVKLIEVIGWIETAGMLERGDIHLGQSLVRAVPPDDRKFGSYPLTPVDLLAACRSSEPLGRKGTVEIGGLASYPLLVLDASYAFRRSFDAACHLAGIKPIIAYESRTPHTLLAMAESGHGVAIIPSAMRSDRHPLRISAVTYRGKPLREPLAMFWDRRRRLQPHAADFCEMLSEHMRAVFPKPRPAGAGKAAGRRLR